VYSKIYPIISDVLETMVLVRKTLCLKKWHWCSKL